MHTVVNKTAQLARDRAVRAYGVALLMLPRRHAPRTTVAPQSVLALCELKQEQRVQIGAARRQACRPRTRRQPSTLDLLFDLVLGPTVQAAWAVTVMATTSHCHSAIDTHYYM